MSCFQKAPRRPTVLLILDGFGANPGTQDNAIAAANTPNFDRLFAKHPLTTIETSGAAVGLPDGQMGNSEVGHITLGCGTILRQDLVAINDAIADGSFFDNKALLVAVRACKAQERALHLLGLVSDGGVHSHLSHVLALIELCRREGVQPLLHMITDGRDTAPQCACDFLPQIESALSTAGGAIASVCGRFYAMDRDKRWERVQRAWALLVKSRGQRSSSAQVAIETAWANGQGDEFIKPTMLDAFEPIRAGDQVVFCNFRNDRPRELSEALALPTFSDFERGDFTPVTMTTMTEYQASYPFAVAFDKEIPLVTLCAEIERANIRQFHCSETEKYPHVTFFFNGGRELPYCGEDRVLIPSPKVATYDLQPEMSANAVANALIDAVQSNQYGFIIANFPNGDMVGHTGVWSAAVQAIEALDREVTRVIECAQLNGFSILLTADHGNCDLMVDPVTNEPHTQHTTFPVPCMVIDDEVQSLNGGCGLSDIAQAVLQLMGLPVPQEMRGRKLLSETIVL